MEVATDKETVDVPEAAKDPEEADNTVDVDGPTDQNTPAEAVEFVDENPVSPHVGIDNEHDGNDDVLNKETLGEVVEGDDVKVESSVISTTYDAGNKAENVTASYVNGVNDREMVEADESATEDETSAFMREVDNFYRERGIEFKHPKFYGEPLDCLKLWRAVVQLGGYERVTGAKLWRQVGESFNPPKTCTTVSWTFRIFYEKALLDYEKYKREIGELEPVEAHYYESTMGDNEPTGQKTPGSGRARRDSASRAMQGWHTQHDVIADSGEPTTKVRSSAPGLKREKNLKSIGSFKQRKLGSAEQTDGPMVLVEGDKQLRSFTYPISILTNL